MKKLIVVTFLVFIFDVYMIVDMSIQGVKHADTLVSRAMSEHNIENYKRVGEIKPDGVGVMDSYRPILIYQGEMEGNPEVLISYNPETESISVINSDFTPK